MVAFHFRSAYPTMALVETVRYGEFPIFLVEQR
jgi:hypothetical protein